MTIAILCSGQGPQHANMFALTGDAPEAAHLFAHAATLLGGSDPRKMVRTITDGSLHQNRIGQILCTLQALAATATLSDAWPRRLLIAGYSVGEVAAWSVAGLMGATMTLDLVARRERPLLVRAIEHGRGLAHRRVADPFGDESGTLAQSALLTRSGGGREEPRRHAYQPPQCQALGRDDGSSGPRGGHR